MKAIPLFTLLFATTVFALDARTVVDYTYKNNPEIKKLQSQIGAKKYAIANSKLLKNPVLSFGFNDINLEYPTKRDLEAMQTNYISISQEIEQDSKLNLKEKIEKLQKSRLEQILIDKKSVITKEIYKIYFQFEKLDKVTLYINKMIKNIQSINKYYANSTELATLEKILENKITIDKLSIKLKSIKNKQTTLMANLQKVSTLQMIENNSLNGLFPKFSFNIHPLEEIANIDLAVSKLEKQLEIEKETPNYTVSGGYFQRDGRDDYVNIALKIPLTIYGKEQNNIKSKHHIIEKSLSHKESIIDELEENIITQKSNKKIAKSSLNLLKSLMKNIKNQISVVSKNNKVSNITKVYKLQNKLLSSQIQLLDYEEKIYISNIELSYLRGNDV